jgi:tryptophan 2,3-dioxygenase
MCRNSLIGGAVHFQGAVILPPPVKKAVIKVGDIFLGWCAAIAQLVEQLICNHQVRGSSPCCGTILKALLSFHIFTSWWGVAKR